MKKQYRIFIIFLLLTINHCYVIAQSVPNGGFESGTGSTCSHAEGTVYNWFIPSGVDDGGIPTWFDINNESCAYNTLYCSGYALPVESALSSSRFIKMTDYSPDYIGVNLGTALALNTHYTLRMKIAGTGCPVNGNSLRVFFSQQQNDWDTGGNQIEATSANIVIGRNSGSAAQWYQVEKNFYANESSLGNLILKCERGGFYIDDVELVPRCNSDRTIANKTYLGSGQGYPYQTYGVFEQASNTVSAGSDVSLEFSSIVEYKAGSSITLSDGFTAKEGSNFTAKIGSCTLTRLSSHPLDSDIKDALPILPITYVNKISIQPNPLDDQTSFKYSVEKESDVSIEVFNAFGQKIATLVKDGKHQSGNYSIPFDAKRLSAGIYFYSFQVNNQRETKRIVIAR